MDKRAKILASVFGALIVGSAMMKVVYPTWIEPLVTIDDRIAERQKELDELEVQVAEVNKARYEYREWAGRSAGFEPDGTITEMREHLNKLLRKHKLADVKVTPTRPSDDRKTGLWKATVTVAGTGGLDSVISFLQEVAELPEVCRVGNASISPASRRGKKTTINRFNLRVPVEVWIVPQQELVGRLEADDLVHPDFFIRHQGRDYSTIWKGDPFNEYVPMRVKTPPTLRIVKDKKVNLEVTVDGGVGPYKYEWSPAKGLSSATTQPPQVDSSETGLESYTVSVTDARGNIGKSTVSVTVAEPPKPRAVVASKNPSPPPPPPARGRDISKDGRMQTLIMVMMRESKGQRRDEIMVSHSRTKQNSYYSAGDQFEGGELIFVHQTGGLVKWKDEYYVYPLGEKLDHFVFAEKAFDYPILQRAAGKYMELTKQMAAVQDIQEKAEMPAAKNVTTKPAGEQPPARSKPADPKVKVTAGREKVMNLGKEPAKTAVLPGKEKKLPSAGSGQAVSPGKKSSSVPSGKRPAPKKPKKRRPSGKTK